VIYDTDVTPADLRCSPVYEGHACSELGRIWWWTGVFVLFRYWIKQIEYL